MPRKPALGRALTTAERNRVFKARRKAERERLLAVEAAAAKALAALRRGHPEPAAAALARALERTDERQVDPEDLLESWTSWPVVILGTRRDIARGRAVPVTIPINRSDDD